MIDLTEVAKSRRNALHKSYLPKVGGSGYGFAWERKKAQQKRKQIKNDVQQASLNKAAARSPTVGPSSASGGDSTLKESENSTSSTEISEKAESSSPLMESVDGPDNQEVDPQTDLTPAEEQDFDPYSYLKENATQDDAVASFFGNAG